MSPVTVRITKHPALRVLRAHICDLVGLVIVVIGPGGSLGTTEQTQSLLAYAVLGMVAGPGIAGIAPTIALDSRPALA